MLHNQYCHDNKLFDCVCLLNQGRDIAGTSCSKLWHW